MLAILLGISSLVFTGVWAQADRNTPITPRARVEKRGAPRKADTDDSAVPAEEPGQDVILAATPSSANYVFATGSGGTFTNMSGSTQLVAAGQDDTASPVTNIGFDFYFMGTRFTQFSASSNGYVRLGGTAVSTTQYTLGTAATSLIASLGSDEITAVAGGKVHYKVTGVAPNRILTVEFANATIIYDGAGATADGNSQVRLHETTGQIELVYGAMDRNTSTGFMGGMDAQYMGFSSGSAANTVATVDMNNTVNTTAATGNQFTLGAPMVNLNTPVDGAHLVYSFTPTAPTAPTGLNFTNVTPTTMTLNWTDSPNEVSYLVQNSTDGTNFTTVGTPAGDSTTFNAASLSPTTNYFWRVIAVSEGAYSTPLSGSQATASPGHVSSTAAGGLWSQTSTWAGGVIPTASDDVTIVDGATVTIDTAAVALDVFIGQGGAPSALTWDATTARTLTVGVNVSISPNGTFSSPATGTVTTHTLSLGGSLTNNGVLDFSTNTDTAGAGITFTGATNNSFSGSGATTDVRTITINKGTSNANTLELMPANFTVRGVNLDSAGYLTVTNGTFKLSGLFGGTNRVFAVAAYTIPATGGFWLNNPNYNVAAQTGNATNNGLLRITTGSYAVGTAVGNSLGGGNGAAFTIEGGIVNIAGRLNTGSAVTYTQSGGVVNVATVGNATSNSGSFALSSAAAVANFNGGQINLVQRATGATILDYRVDGVVNGGSTILQAGTGATATNFDFRLRGNLPTLVVDNTTNAKSVLFSTAAAEDVIFGNTTITTGATFNLNDAFVIPVGASFVNNGSVVGATANARLYFGGDVTQTYSGTGTMGSAASPITSLDIDNGGSGLVFDSAVQNAIVGRIDLFTGGITNANKLTLGGGGATPSIVQIGNTTTPTGAGIIDAPPVFNLGTGGESIFYLRVDSARTTGNEVNPTRTLAAMEVDDNVNNQVTIAGGDLNVNGTGAALTLTTGRVITGANTLYLSNSAATVAVTSGYVDGNFKKNFSAAASKLFEVGTANGYSPVTANVTAGTGDLTVAAVQGKLPAIPGTNALQRFWTMTGPGLTADLTLQYLAGDVVGTEANYQVERYDGAFTVPAGSSIDAVNHRGLAPGIGNLTASWTAAEPGAIATPGALQFSSPTYSVGEAGGTATITVSRTGGSSGTVGVSYATVAGGTATGGASCGGSVDYVNTSGALSFGDTEVSKSFTVPVCNDATTEPDETVDLQLTTPTGGATLGGQTTAVLTILDDDAVLPVFNISDARVTEGGPGAKQQMQFTVSLDFAARVAPDGDCPTVNYHTSDGTAKSSGADYVPEQNGFLSFCGGDRPGARPDGGPVTRTINITVLGDNNGEENETFFVDLTNPVGGTIGDGHGVGIIVDDDRAYVSDLDNDKKGDISVFRPSDGNWYTLASSKGVNIYRHFGVTGDRPVPGDYDGDGHTDLAVFRPSTGIWYVEYSHDLSLHSFYFGLSTDLPVQGDYDGDGKTDVAVFRSGVWYILQSSNGLMNTILFGTAGDVPVPGDFDGDDITDVAVFRAGTWYVQRSSDHANVAQPWGTSGDVPVIGDFDGDGSTDFTVYRHGTWYILQSLTGSIRTVNFGLAGDQPVVADYDGDGTSDVGVFRSGGSWFILRSSDSAVVSLNWGLSGDIPIPAAYLPQ